MSKELLLVIEAVANEKEVEREIIFQAMEEALAAASKKLIDSLAEVKVVIDRKSGLYKTYRLWEVIAEDAELENPKAQFYVDVANEKGHDVSVGDIIEEEIESVDFGRISAQSARQVILQKVREAEREKLIERFKNQIGKVFYGEVKRVTRDFILIDLGDRSDGMLPRDKLLPKETFKVGDKVRAVLAEIDDTSRNYPLRLSRIANEMVEALFELEVPEISEEVIEIVAIARDAGTRCKIAVKTNDGRIDPVGACVGMRGTRVQSITNELKGERIDIILWDDNPVQYVINALSPAEIISIIQDEDKNTIDVAVKEDQLSQAIGRNGQNVRLASELTGWKLNVMAESEAQERQNKEAQSKVKVFMDALDVDEDVATVLFEEGFTQLEEVAYVSLEEMLEIEGFNEDIAQELQERAKTALLTQALSNKKRPADDLLSMEGMDESLAQELANAGIITMEDLAEQAVDDLLDVVEIDRERAAELILTARRPWFEEN
ncbi:transcription termination factor NusA [Thiotrichales bacterium 19S11-10]|nr:transcription termination factor NusA [Thiotrichales bacterium 19S11-10]MCF6807002.1 transcription termination factor NusA [Thiotrichales bacterium 19S9-11]MCF6810971.1 transcription termination factor NusA [Thiotrichales bacterium 19S9-12]